MKHVVITGYIGAGKSTLINRLIEEIGRPVTGYITKKEDGLRDEQLGSPIYIYEPGKPRAHTPDNLLGYCKDRHFQTIEGAFDRWAPRLKQPVEKDHLIVMDEIGFMESKEKAFCEAIMHHLDGDIPVIAAVKDRDLPFLEAVRSHPKCHCFYLEPENREACFHEALAFLKAQLEVKE